MFIMGDLHFRTRIPGIASSDDKEASIQKALELVHKKDFETLYSYDELQADIDKKEVLVDFQTLPCHFNSTFKVKREAGFKYKTQQTPSFTDRILYRSAIPGSLVPLAYEPCPLFTTSNRKPIRGAFWIITNTTIDANAQQQAPVANSASSATAAAPCSYTLKFHKMACTDLPAMDVMGTSDPYNMIPWNNDAAPIAMTYIHEDGSLPYREPSKSGGFLKTKPVKRTKNPVFKLEQFSLSFNGPVPAEAMLYVTVMDWDITSKDDWIGSIPINLLDLVSQLSNNNNNTNGYGRTQ